MLARPIGARWTAAEDRLADSATVAATAVSAALIAIAAPGALVQDSWSTLAAGRLVASGGIPHRELLTAWAQGRNWIDQQWLAQLLFYRVEALAGMSAVLALSALLSCMAWLGAVALARRRGASGPALLVWGPTTLLAAPWAFQARAQSFALPLFVALVALVFSDSRRRSPRVFATLPLLALWGNLHGTALLGACILSVHALLMLARDVIARAHVRAGALRAAVLAGGGFLALAVNPYGFGIVTYYRTMVINPPFASLVQEWEPSTPSTAVAAFYAVAVIGIAIVIHNRRRLTLTETTVFLLLLAAAVDAVRNITWFALAILILAPALSRTRWSPPTRLAAPARAGLLVGASLTLAGAVAAFPSSVAAQLTRHWSMRGPDVVLIAAREHPAARVLADDRHADFLLWAAPELQGRILADVRFELLTRSELHRLARFEGHPQPQDAPSARLVVLDPRRDPLPPWRTNNWKQLYADTSIALYERQAASAG